ncbi:MAG TPA: ATP-grasp domain-containing protein [Acidimicrobiia bacterium]|nr:ATP-grasp domain-containing protein [Acidimicrobiia bacterium]
MARVLLVLPTSSYRVDDFLDAAASLGVQVAVACEEDLPLMAAPASSSVDRFVRIDCADPARSAEQLADLAATTPIDAIVPVDDAGVVVAALAATRLGLPHNSPEAAATTRNKAALRAALSRSEVAQPAFRLLDPAQPPLPVAAALGYPLVVKPLTLSASRGVIKVEGPADLETSIARVRSIRREAGEADDEPLLLERFVEGPEVAVEAMLWEGDLEVLAIFDKPMPLTGPFFEETIYVTPSRLPAETQADVERVTGAAIRALGLREGPVHAELRVSVEAGPVVIEVAARSIGGVCSRALRFGLLDTSLETLILRHAVGRRQPSLRRHRTASGVMMMPIPRSGTLREIAGLEVARAVPGITRIDITAPVGTYLRPAPEADRYLGFIFAAGTDPAQVVAALESAHRSLKVVLD